MNHQQSKRGDSLLLSVIIPTLNNEGDIQRFFSSFDKQSYPKKDLEIIATDGGSTDNTISLLKTRGVTVINNPHRLAEPGISLGMNKAKGDIIMVLALDNFYTDKNALKTIVGVFHDKNIYAAFPKHDSKDNYSIFSRYHNTFTDPFNHFVYGYAANARTFYRLYKILKNDSIYTLFDFLTNKARPMIAFAQGFTIRGNYIRKSEDFFDDCKPIIELINEHKMIAYVHSVSIYHDTIRNFAHFVKKQRWATQNALEQKEYGITHRLKYLTKLQKLKIKLWPLYALSFFLPLLRSFYGLIQDKNWIWLFHPFVCWSSAYSSILAIVSYNLIDNRNISRQ